MYERALTFSHISNINDNIRQIHHSSDYSLELIVLYCIGLCFFVVEVKVRTEMRWKYVGY